ncbi:MAG: vitamin K epoxide reductase [Acidobacteria bacterium]|nr:vitamin K epoxide reductase [Acidobacteriota bacterium]
MSDDQHEHHGPGMAARGVTRPMALKEIREQHEHGEQHGGHDRSAMLGMHHRQTLWVYWFLIMLGVWLVLNPLTFGYTQGTVEPSGGRDVWLTLGERAAAMKWSDILSGFLLIVFGWRSLRPNRPISLWICCFVGVWLTMAPVVFWSPTAAGFLNGSLVGMLVIGLTIMIPGMPNMIMFMAHGTTVPKGWSYNPSSWPQRWIMIAVGFVGYFVSRYLAAFQLGYIDFAWDPFFGDQTRQVLNSEMSHSFPISDAAMGTAAYTFEFLMGFMGSPQRWRTMPWMVFVFGILVIPLGLVHIFLVISQPVVVGHWCTFCLLAAAVMLPMIPLEVDEVVAMGQFMVQAKRKQLNLWKAFWLGGDVEGEGDDERSPALASLPEQPGKVFASSIWGMSFPWTLVVSALLGIGLMFVPAFLGGTGSVAEMNQVGGALILTMATLAMGEPMRLVRYLNVLLGLGVAAAPWLLGGAPAIAAFTSALVGLAVAALALPRGEIRERYGLWQRFVR